MFCKCFAFTFENLDICTYISNCINNMSPPSHYVCCNDASKTFGSHSQLEIAKKIGLKSANFHQALIKICSSNDHLMKRRAGMKSRGR